MTKEQKDKEREQAEKMKQLRRELEEKLEEQLEMQLPSVMVDESTRVEVQSVNENEALDPERAKRIVEALLFASGKPLTIPEMRRVMKSLTPREIENIVTELSAEYVRDGRSFEVVGVANGYEIATKREYAPWIFKVELQKKAKQVTQSALETLAILAYKQPITRAEIEELRGVDASGVIATLSERGFIKIVGKKEVPGRPFMYGTTEKFLEHFGLKSLEEMPNIQEIKTIVENSIKKEELLGTQKMVPVNQEGSAEGAAEVSAEAAVSAEGEADAAAESEPGMEEEQTRGDDESQSSAQ